MTLPPKTQLPTCVHARLPYARPANRTGYSPWFLSHIPPIDFCNRIIHEHTYDSLKPCCFLRCKHRASQVISPRERIISRVITGQGLNFSFDNPHHNDRSSQWIYPNLIGSDTSCHQLMWILVWKAKPTTLRYWSQVEPTDPTGNTFLHCTPSRVASLAFSRKKTSSTPPEMPSTRRSFPREKQWFL